MSYKLYLDKSEIFECEVSVKNASLKGSVARLIIESTDGVNFVFNGSIQNDKCNIPIRKLKGLLDENARGNMFLEVIVEDTYFKPWESDFIVEEHTSIKVKVNEQQKPQSKPIVEVKNIPSSSVSDKSKKSNKINPLVPLYELTNLFEKFNINRKNALSKKNDLYQIINEYFRENPEFIPHRKNILNGVKEFLS